MRSRSLFGGVALVMGVAFACATANAATYTYIGSWEVDQGPSWTTGPLAYTGQEAAALLFGGTASEYVISTNGDNPATINFDAWYSVFSVSGGSILAQNYVYLNTDTSGNNFCCGLYYNGNPSYSFGNADSPASAYVTDNAIGSSYTNYAFEVTSTPLPAALPLFATGLGAMGLLGWRRKRKNAAVIAA